MKTQPAPTSRHLVLACAVLCLLAAGYARATDFSLRFNEPGPGHRLPSYWWTYNKGLWELTPPEGCTLLGGGELRLVETDHPLLTAICRPTTDGERDLLAKEDKKARADYVRTLLPGGITDVQLVSQSKNPLPVNGLSNFDVVYSYNLGGVLYQFLYMVSQGGEDTEQSPPVPGQPTPAPTPKPTPGPDGKPVRHGEFFTTIIANPQEQQEIIHGAFQRLMATARIKPGNAEAGASLQYASHGMLGR